MQIPLASLTKEIFDSLLVKGGVFYPGAGGDLHPISIFGASGEAQLFVNADYASIPDAKDLDNVPGYRVAFQQDIGFVELCMLVGADRFHPYPDQWTDFVNWQQINIGLSKWVALIALPIER